MNVSITNLVHGYLNDDIIIIIDTNDSLGLEDAKRRMDNLKPAQLYSSTRLCVICKQIMAKRNVNNHSNNSNSMSNNSKQSNSNSNPMKAATATATTRIKYI